MLALVVVMSLGFSTVADASILLPETGLLGDNSLDAERLIAEMEKQKSDSSGASSSGASNDCIPLVTEEEKRPIPQEDKLAWQLAAMASQTDGSTSGTSSSTSVSGGAGSGASILAIAAAILPDDPLVDRNAADLALSIPDAPGTEMLRPPQHLSLI